MRCASASSPSASARVAVQGRPYGQKTETADKPVVEGGGRRIAVPEVIQYRFWDGP